MTSYEFGDVVLAPCPFTDQTTSKKRPAVVVSSAAYNEERLDLIIIALTSQLRPLSLGRGECRAVERSWSFETIGHKADSYDYRKKAHP